jgi:hypothetical protein
MDLIEAGNPALVNAMHQIASQNSAENRNRLYSIMLQSMFIIPTPAANIGLQPGMNTLTQGANIQILILNDNNGTQVTPFFTGVDALRSWHPNVPYIGLGARDLFNIVLRTQVQEIVINPFDPARKMLHPGGRVKRLEFELLAKGSIPPPSGRVDKLEIQAAQQVMIGVPSKELSSEVQESLVSTAEKITDIAELYLFQMATHQDGQWASNTAIGIQLTDGPREKSIDEIVKQLGGSAYGKVPQGEALDFIVLHGDFGEEIRARGILLFRRTSN